MDEVRLQSYSTALEVFPDKAIAAVLARLASAKLAEYEPRIPEKGELIGQVHAEARRLNQPRECDECGNTGMLIEEVDGKREARRCQCWLDWKAASAK